MEWTPLPDSYALTGLKGSVPGMGVLLTGPKCPCGENHARENKSRVQHDLTALRELLVLTVWGGRCGRSYRCDAVWGTLGTTPTHSEPTPDVAHLGPVVERAGELCYHVVVAAGVLVCGRGGPCQDCRANCLGPPPPSLPLLPASHPPPPPNTHS